MRISELPNVRSFRLPKSTKINVSFIAISNFCFISSFFEMIMYLFIMINAGHNI